MTVTPSIMQTTLEGQPASEDIPIETKLLFVKITGAGINSQFRALSHVVRAFPSNTYHVFKMETGAMLWFNDFGVRSLVIAHNEKDIN